MPDELPVHPETLPALVALIRPLTGVDLPMPSKIRLLVEAFPTLGTWKYPLRFGTVLHQRIFLAFCVCPAFGTCTRSPLFAGSLAFSMFFLWAAAFPMFTIRPGSLFNLDPLDGVKRCLLTEVASMVGALLWFFLDAGFLACRKIADHSDIPLVFVVHPSFLCSLDSPWRKERHLWIELAVIVGAGLWFFLDVRVLVGYCNVSLMFGVCVWFLLSLDSPRSANKDLWAGLGSTISTFLGSVL